MEILLEDELATNIVMPQMGYDMREGTVVKWHKVEGDVVTRGDVIADIETDKATVEFEAYTSGVIGRIVASEGQVVPVGDLIAIITSPGEDISSLDVVNAVPELKETQDNGSTIEPAVDSEDPPSSERRASPIARRLA